MAGRLFDNIDLNCDDSQWKIKGIRGVDAEPLIDYIVLAEFDIDTGKD